MPQSGEITRGSGGLVSALLGVSLNDPFVWMGFETDAKNARQLELGASKIAPNMILKSVLIEPKIYNSYYDGFCNDVLWPLFHYEGQHTFFHRQYWNSYKEANQLMADEILKIATPDDTIWIHDFHFFLLPELIKKSKPHLKVGFFLHIPFPSSEIFRQLPVREEILKSLLYCDLLGFHEYSYLRHFTVSLQAQLGIEASPFRVQYQGHTVHLGVYPISIDSESLKKRSRQSDVVQQTENFAQRIHSPFVILGIDRLDYTKGLELKLKGFYRLLHKYPQLRGKAKLLQVAIPTRVKVPSYIKLKKQIDQLVGTINGEFGTPDYTPVNYIFNSVNERDLLALYRRASSLLVTSKRDGMNLVAMEYAVVKSEDDPGVLILSEFAGAASLLGSALIINPWDEDSIADALYQAYTMSVEERRQRLESLQTTLSKYSATQWAKSFLSDLEDMATPAARRATRLLSTEISEWPPEVLKKISNSPKICLILDYDGTLVAHKDTPEQALLDREIKSLLQQLHQHFSIYVASGRNCDFLDEQFKGESFFLAAEHGAYYRESKEWKTRISSDVQSWYSQIKRMMDDYSERVPLSFVEQKSAALVWHYRRSPKKLADFQAKKLLDELVIAFANEPVRIVQGAKIVEAKAVECNKGGLVRWLMSRKGKDQLFIAIGDDRTDEDMFKVLKGRGITIKVGPEKTFANYRLEKQEDIVYFLKTLLKIKTGEESSMALPSASSAH